MKSISLVAIAFLAISLLTPLTGSAKAAGPGWDTDYELYVGVPTWEYRLWIKAPGASWTSYGTYDTKNEANNWLFFLVEHNVVPLGSSVYIQTVAAVDWYYWLTFETYAQASDAADDWEGLGFQTDIRSVFGGYYYDNNQNFSIW